jgi:hypothetical protein
MSARSPWLLRVLVPSWRFFEAEDARFLLEVRTWREGEAPSPFLPAVPTAARGRWAWLFSPEHNLRLFCHDLIERFVFELAEHGPLAESELEKLASYQRVLEVVRWFLEDARAVSLTLSRGERGSERFQVRLVAIREDDAREELFVSPYYPVLA